MMCGIKRDSSTILQSTVDGDPNDAAKRLEKMEVCNGLDPTESSKGGKMLTMGKACRAFKVIDPFGAIALS